MHSVEELLEAVKGYDTKEVYVIGGSSVYEQLLPYCDTAHVTKIDHAYEADAWFPNLDEDPDWEITADSDEQYYFDLTYHSLSMSAKGLSTDGKLWQPRQLWQPRLLWMQTIRPSVQFFVS